MVTDERRRQSGLPTVLVVEDDATVLSLTRGVLEREGYVVLTAPGGEEALAHSRDRRAAIDLLITDLVMPHMSGDETMRALRDLNPHLRVLVVSGYVERSLAAVGGGAFDPLGPDASFLAKPFSPTDLVRRVRELLDLDALAA